MSIKRVLQYFTGPFMFVLRFMSNENQHVASRNAKQIVPKADLEILERLHCSLYNIK